MTALDDALNNTALVFTPPNLTADWFEQYPSESTDGNPDSVRELGQQMTGDFVINHSLDDGFPDPVTMTTGNDASGTLSATLNGKDRLIGDLSGWRTSTGGTGVGTTITTTLPTDRRPGDYILVAVALNSTTPVETVVLPTAESSWPWELLGDITDGAGLRTIIYGRRTWTSATPLVFSLSVSASYSWTCAGVWASTANGWPVPVEYGGGNANSEVSSVTSHVSPSLTTDSRGYLVGVWALVSATSTWSTADTELDERASVVDLMMSRTTAVKFADTYTLTATSTGATAVATKSIISMVIVDRPRMDAMAYFSPFNVDSPVYGWDRDIADTVMTFNVLTATGPVGTVLHKGQMADIGINGRQAELTAVSETRINLARSMVLPQVWSDRENCTIDWLATWIMARGGQYVGPGPTSSAVYWAPLYGSTHAHFDSPWGYNSARYYDASGGPFGLRPPTIVDGPFMLGMYAQQSATRTEEIQMRPIGIDERDTTQFNTTTSDILSVANSKGRLSFWVRCDPVTAAPSYLGSPDTFIFQHLIYNTTYVNGIESGVVIQCQSSDRMIKVAMGGAHTDFTYVVFTGTGALPADGAWHFVAVAWDWIGGTAKVRIDGTETTSNFWLTGAKCNVLDLPATDKSHFGNSFIYYRFHIPVADVQQESRPYTDTWSYMYPSPSVGGNAVMRPTNQPLVVIAEVAPVIGWDALVELAQSSLSAYRTDELDNMNFLPLSYFGETAQMTATEVVDTEVNAGQLDVKLDPTKARNAVTVQFPETRVDTRISPILDISSTITLPRGPSTMVFALDFLAAETHGAADYTAAAGAVINLTDSQITSGPLPTTTHFMTVNTLPDGTGTVLDLGYVSARVIAGDASTVTVQFQNQNLAEVYLANDGDQVPFLQILGYAVWASDGYVTQRDPGSINKRKERALDSQLPWIQDRRTATEIAGEMVVALSRPHAEVSITVMGDPRRIPGQSVTIADSEGTQASGIWRILSIKHNGAGAQYTQDLKLVSIYPPFIWDDYPGWDYSVWGE